MYNILSLFFYIPKKKKNNVKNKTPELSHTIVPKEWIDGNKTPIWDEQMFNNKIYLK